MLLKRLIHHFFVKDVLPTLVNTEPALIVEVTEVSHVHVTLDSRAPYVIH